MPDIFQSDPATPDAKRTARGSPAGTLPIFQSLPARGFPGQMACVQDAAATTYDYNFWNGTAWQSLATLPTHIQDANADTVVHTEQAAGEDKVRIKIAGIERGLFQALTPHITLTGDVKIDGPVGIGAVPSPNTSAYIYKAATTLTTGWSLLKLETPFNFTFNGNSLQYNAFYCSFRGKMTSGNLNFIFKCFEFDQQLWGGGVGTTCAMMSGYAIQQNYVFTGTLAAMYGMWLGTPSVLAGTPVVTTSYGIYVGDYSSDTAAVTGTAYGIKIEDQTKATTNIIAELGPATPYLRLAGGAVPGANNTNLYLAEGNPAVLRRVQWKAGNALVAGDKVMVLV